MPTYEYKCLDCGTRFECFQNMSEPELEECEQCNGRVKRLIGAGAGIIFRGSGFYCTDYRRDDSGGHSSKQKSDGSKSSTDSQNSDSGKGSNKQKQETAKSTSDKTDTS